MAWCCGFVSWELDLYSCASLFLKIRNPNSTNLAGSLDGASIHNTISKTKTLFRDRTILQRSFTQSFDASLVFTDCSAIATATCALAALLLFEAITLPPPLRPRRGLTHLGGRHNVEFAEQAQKKNFLWTSACAGYRSITVVETHTLRCRHGIPVVSASFIRRVRPCHGCVLAEAAEDNFARHTARALYPQQGCGHVEP